VTHSNEQHNQPERDDDHQSDNLVKRLWGHLLEIAPSAAVDAAGDRVWDAIRNELMAKSVETEAEAVPAAGLTTARPLRSQSIFQYRNLLAMASSVLVVASSAMFYVAFKQRQNGIVVSTVKQSEQPLRAKGLARPNRDWLPEEREIWRSLSEQLAQRDGDEFVFKSEVWDSLNRR